jgi:valyl-tRNA synthetase
MARVKDLKVVLKSEDSPAKSIMGATTHTEVFLPLEGVIDLDEQIKRLEKEIGKTQKELDKYIKKSENKKFLDNAPDDVVLEVKENKTLLQQKVDSLNNSLKNFKA